MRNDLFGGQVPKPFSAFCARREGSLTTSQHDVTAALNETLCQRIGLPRYRLWFENKTKITWETDGLLVGVSNHFFQEWLQKTFAEDIGGAAASVLGQPIAIRFAIDPELFQAARREQAAQTSAVSAARGSLSEDHGPQEHDQHGLPTMAPRPGTTGHGPQSRPRPQRRWLQLDDFVVGPCNRVAHASALSLVEEPGQGPIPLVLYGPVGTGKTHLLEGIFAGLKKTRSDWRLCYVTAEEFTNRFVQAMRLGKLTAFRKHFRECDGFLLDDLQFLANKPATQEEFLHTLNSLLSEDRLVALSCDCHPRLADQFLPELTDRLLGGAVWGLNLPDRDTRLDLLRSKVGRRQTMIAEDVLAYLAEQLRGNVRELEGALHSIQHLSRVTGRRIDLALAKEAVAELVRHSVRVVQLADVEKAVCAVLGLNPSDLQSKKRGWAQCHPRMLAMYLARKVTGATYTEIGQRFGGRNHSTTLAAEKKVKKWIDEDGSLTLGDRQVRVRDVIDRVTRELLR
jgi:chromosomal replication initiator protein